MLGPLAPVRGGGEVPLDTNQGSLQRGILTPHAVGRSLSRRRSICIPALEHAPSSRGTSRPSRDAGQSLSSRGHTHPDTAADGAVGEPTSARESSRQELGLQRVTRSPLGRSASMCSFPTQDEREAEAQRQGRRASRRVANRSPPLDSRRQPTPRLVQDLVGYYMPREDLGKQGLMLDPELYTPNRLIKRDACRFHPRVRRVLQRIWRLSIAAQGGGATIGKDTYISMFRRVSRCLIRDFEPTRAWEDSVLEVDWAYDSGGRGSVDKEAYKLSWFQLADQWTPGISGDEYASFLESLLAQLAVPSQPPAVTGDTAGEPAAAGDDEHAAEGDGEWPATPEGLATPESEGGEESSLRLRDESALAYMGPAQGSPGSDKASPVEDTAGEEGRGGQGEPHVPSGDGDREGEGEDTPQQQQQQLSDTESPPPAAPSAGATKAEEEEAPPPVGPDKQVQVAVPVAARVARQDSLWMDRYLGQAPTVNLRRGEAHESQAESEASSSSEEEVEPPHLATHTADAATWLGNAGTASPDAAPDAAPRRVKPRSARALPAQRAATKPRVAATGYGREQAPALPPAGEVHASTTAPPSAAGVSPPSPAAGPESSGEGDVAGASPGPDSSVEAPSVQDFLPAAEVASAVGDSVARLTPHVHEPPPDASYGAALRPWEEAMPREPVGPERTRGRFPPSPPPPARSPVRLAPLPHSPLKPASRGAAACMTSTPILASRHGELGTPPHQWCCPRSPLMLPSRAMTPPPRRDVIERHANARRSLPPLQRPSTRRLGKYLDRLPPVDDDALARVGQAGVQLGAGPHEAERDGARRPSPSPSPPSHQQHVASLRLMRAQPVMEPGPRFADPGGRLSLAGALSRQEAADREFMRPRSRWNAADTSSARLRRKYATRLKRAAEARPEEQQQAPQGEDVDGGDEALRRLGGRAWERIALAHWLPRRVHEIHQGRSPTHIDATGDGSKWR